jgi:RNase adapter protein RapZ
MTKSKTNRLFVITGMSGAGKSSALHAMEDLGFETVDNLPTSLLEAALRGGGPDRPLAVGMDVRTRNFDAEILVKQLQDLGGENSTLPTLIYLDSDDDILMRRYKETRRPHPLARDLPVAGAIALERRLLAPVKSAADLVLDTSAMTQADLKRSLEKTYGGKNNRPMHIHLVSFGYRNGVPRDADLVFDVRFLRNPHYVPALKPQSGLDEAVGAYVAADPDFSSFMSNLETLLMPLLPRYRDEGKSYLTIAIGCTGGRHRSVYTLTKLAKWLTSIGIEFDFQHRDLNVQPSNPG